MSVLLNMLCSWCFPPPQCFIPAEEATTRALRTVAGLKRVDARVLTPVSPFKDLGMDELDCADAVARLEAEFAVKVPSGTGIGAVQDFVDFVTKHSRAK